MLKKLLEVVMSNNNNINGSKRLPKLWEAIFTFLTLIVIMALGIIVFKVDPHVPMFVGVISAALMALRLGYKWDEIESFMISGVSRAMGSIMILIVIGILIGVWIVSGVVPTMIYYGLKLISPKIFLVAALLICSITSLATGTSWGTMGTMGLALMGISQGLGIPLPATAGAVISGAYFGDKMSPLSDTTNLAPAMAGSNVFSHIRFMIFPTSIAYLISVVFFGALSLHYSNGLGDSSIEAVGIISKGLSSNFNLNPILLLPPIVVILAVVKKAPALPGIVIGIFLAAILGMIIQGDNCSLGDVLNCGMNGFASNTGVKSIDKLLSTGGITNMLFSVSLTIISMMFGGIMEETKQLDVIVSRLLNHIKRDGSLIALTEVTCLASNVTMPEQYISIVVPGRMYEKAYRERGLSSATLSSALENSGTVTSALVPWNTCGTFIKTTLQVSTFQYLPFAIFNYLMPIINIVLAYMGITVANTDGVRKRDLRKAKDIDD